jgi:hypothetical protein
MFLSRTSNHCVVMRHRNTKSELEQLRTCNKKEFKNWSLKSHEEFKLLYTF